MSTEQSNNNQTNQPKRVDPYAAWATDASVRRALCNDGMANGDTAVKRVTQFCQAEMARVIEVNVVLPEGLLVTTFLHTLETALVNVFGPEDAVVVRRFVGTLATSLGEANLMSLANELPAPEKPTAMRLAATIPVLTATPRQLADSELMEALWTPTRPAFLPAVAPVPAGVLVEVTSDTLVLQAKDVWRHILREKNLDSDRNLDQAMAWALNFGLTIFKQLPLQDRLNIASSKVVHARLINPKKKKVKATTPTT
jgi:hypothetical protein